MLSTISNVSKNFILPSSLTAKLKLTFNPTQPNPNPRFLLLLQRENFDHSGRDIRVWIPTIEKIWKTHKLERENPSKLNVFMFPDGECPAFLVEKKFVLKFYPVWARTSTYVVERNVYELLRHCGEFVRQHTPTMVVASFLIRPGTEDKGLAYMTPSKGTVWKWPYIITTVLDNAINEHYSQQAPVTGMYSLWPAELDDYIKLPVPLPDGAERAAAFVGKWMRLYHDDMVATKSRVVDHLLRLKELAEVDAKNWNVWTAFASFIMKQRRNLPFLQGFIKALPPTLMDQLERRASFETILILIIYHSNRLNHLQLRSKRRATTFSERRNRRFSSAILRPRISSWRS